MGSSGILVEPPLDDTNAKSKEGDRTSPPPRRGADADARFGIPALAFRKSPPPSLPLHSPKSREFSKTKEKTHFLALHRLRGSSGAKSVDAPPRLWASPPTNPTAPASSSQGFVRPTRSIPQAPSSSSALSRPCRPASPMAERSGGWQREDGRRTRHDSGLRLGRSVSERPSASRGAPA